MRKKKWLTTNQRHTKRMLKLVLAFFMFMGIGYSALSTKLSINGNLEVAEYDRPTLYNVLKKEANSGGLALKYTGEHHDSFTEEPSKDVYYWYAKNDTEGTTVLDKNNVIFAGHCWQMIRTTDTGGVKMIYNGEAEDGKCLNTRGTHVGYNHVSTQEIVGDYWYGTDYTYDSTNKTFKVSGTTEQVTWNATTGPGLIGKYTCKLSSESGECATLYLVESYIDATNANIIELNSNSHFSQFGTLQYNFENNSLASAGYMYNQVYESKRKVFVEPMLSTSKLETTYWYADSVIWGSPISNNYNLDNPYKINNSSLFFQLKDKYTFLNTTQNYTDDEVYYISGVNNTTMYYILLSDGNDLSYYNYTYTYGDSYIDNHDGTYTITNKNGSNPTTINRSDWYTSYNNVGEGKYVCKNAVNNSCSDLWVSVSNSREELKYMLLFKYGNGFTYNQSTGTYTLNNDSVITTPDKDIIKDNHYTCWNTSGECSTISYIFGYDSNSREMIYIDLIGGKGVENAIDDMLHSDNVNTKNSTIKNGVDAWYKHFMLEDFDEYVEDIIFCNDRTIRLLNGWNPNGGNIFSYNSDEQYLLFEGYYPFSSSTNDLICTNTTDRFSLSNPNGRLIYKVGLMTQDDMSLVGQYIRKTGAVYWIMSPSLMTFYDVTFRYVSSSGTMNGSYGAGYTRIGLRPAVSLKPGIEYTDGNGSMANPYIIKTESNTGA